MRWPQSIVSEVLEHIGRIYSPLNLANMKMKKLPFFQNNAPDNQRVLTLHAFLSSAFFSRQKTFQNKSVSTSRGEIIFITYTNKLSLIKIVCRYCMLAYQKWANHYRLVSFEHLVDLYFEQVSPVSQYVSSEGGL